MHFSVIFVFSTVIIGSNEAEIYNLRCNKLMFMEKCLFPRHDVVPLCAQFKLNALIGPRGQQLKWTNAFPLCGKNIGEIPLTVSQLHTRKLKVPIFCTTM